MEFKNHDLLDSVQVAGDWIHDLAQGELHPETEILNGGRRGPEQLIEQSAMEFMSKLRHAFEEYARLFNSYSDSSRKFQEVKVYSVAQSPCDFILFRNQVKFVVSYAVNGVIQLSFVQNAQPTVSINGMGAGSGMGSGAAANHQPPSRPRIQELIAQVGPFRDVIWTFQSEKVSPEQIARYYFGEFTRSSRDVKASKLSNDVLLEQIRSLLQEKGINL